MIAILKFAKELLDENFYDKHMRKNQYYKVYSLRGVTLKNTIGLKLNKPGNEERVTLGRPSEVAL